jgi:ADP-ribose pyrophosphatase
MRSWKRAHGKRILKTPIFSILAEEWRSPRNRHRHTFYLLKAPDWVNIIPIDSAGRVILIRQHRYGSRRLELEIPGGAVDHRDRTPLAAAKRELAEETGYVSHKWVKLGKTQPNPAFHRNNCHMFLALHAAKKRRQRLDFAEEITVTPTLLRNIPNLIARGRITHALVICAFHAMFAETHKLKVIQALGRGAKKR